MKQIVLTNSPLVVLVDDECFNQLNIFKWYLSSVGYAIRHEKNKVILMHRELLFALKSINIDHIDANKLNNQKNNLRYANKQQNQANRNKNRNNTSGYKGVVKVGKKWRAEITFNYKNIYLGRFDKIEDAASAYNVAAIKYFGSFAKINDVKKSKQE